MKFLNRKYKYLLWAIVLMIFFSCRHKENKVELKLSTYSYDLGEIVADSIYHGVVTVINPGKSKLVINEVSTGCGCTKAFVDNNTIEPKDSSFLHFSFNPKGRQGEQDEYVILGANTDSIIHILQVKAVVQ